MGKSEKSFASIYGRGVEFYDYTLVLGESYAPDKVFIKRESINDKLGVINSANNTVASEKAILLEKIKIKNDSIVAKETGLIALSGKVRDAIGSFITGGKKAREFILVQKECQKMVNYRKAKKKETPPPSEPPTAEEKKKRSTSETGDAAVVGYAKNILECIKTIPGYTSANPAITIAGYGAKITAVEANMSTVNTTYDVYDDAVEIRYDHYEGALGLREIFTVAHQYLLYTFGKDSNEYKDGAKIKY